MSLYYYKTIRDNFFLSFNIIYMLKNALIDSRC